MKQKYKDLKELVYQKYGLNSKDVKKILKKRKLIKTYRFFK
jgi:hypothetical protein